ncbi:MAG: hypothetical protein ACKOCL_01140 [Candidatus Nanopelagicaceae bacterium]
MELSELKSHWNEVLFALESRNRVAWLTFFDARLAALESSVLKLDVSDPEKFSGAHSYTDSRAKFAPVLLEVILEITGEKLELSW